MSGIFICRSLVTTLFVVGLWVMTAMLIFFTALTSFACTMLTEAMALIPGNERFQKRIEFSNLVHILFGQKLYIAQQICYNLAMQSLNIASIIVTAQVSNCDSIIE
jgi:hypothetical protein